MNIIFNILHSLFITKTYNLIKTEAQQWTTTLVWLVPEDHERFESYKSQKFNYLENLYLSYIDNWNFM